MDPTQDEVRRTASAFAPLPAHTLTCVPEYGPVAPATGVPPPLTLTNPPYAAAQSLAPAVAPSRAADAAAAADPPPGYLIEGELGRGAMGVVYKARQYMLNRPVALKMILGGAADPGTVIRFLAEADAVAAVRHPNVVQVYAYGDHDGRPYMALEFCPGGTLADRGREAGRVAPAVAAGLIGQIAAGVGAAHAEGIVHRDLKPGNVLLDAAGVLKVADFGLAKRGGGADLTHTGAVMGTPAYMAPEQARGGAKFVGPGADVWAIGVMLYEMLAGVRPFTGDTTWDVLRAVGTAAPVPIRKAAPGVPRDLALVCEKCLRPDARDRYPTAAELAADLARFQAGEPVSARPVPGWERAWRWVRRNPVGAAAVAAGAGLAAAVVVASLATARLARRDAALAKQQLAEQQREQSEWAKGGERFHRAEVAARAADAIPLNDHQAVRAWSDVLRDADAATDILSGVPGRGDAALPARAKALFDRAQAQLAAAQDLEDAHVRADRLAEQHAAAVFAAADFPGTAAPDGLARTRAAAAAGLAEFGITPDRTGPPAADARNLTARQIADVAERCYELLVLEARALLRDRPADPAAARRQAREALASLDRADRVIAPRPPPQAGLRVRADVLAALDDGAAAAARDAAAAAPFALAADHFFAALAQARRGEYAPATTHLNAALTARPDHPGAEYLLAVCRLKEGQPQAAREGLTRLIDRHPGLPWPRLLRGFAAIDMRHWDEARADFDAVLATRPEPAVEYVARVNLGVMAMTRRNWPAAVGDLRAATAVLPTAPAAYINLALAERQEAGVPGWRQEAMALAPGGVVALAVVEAAQRAARTRAVAVLDDAVAKCPPAARLFHERGRLRVQLGQFPAAKADFTRAVELGAGGGGSSLADDWIELGRLRDQDDEPAAAVQAFEAALAAGPDRAIAWRLMARPLMALGRFREAAAALDKYLATAPVAPGTAPGPDLAAAFADALRAKGLAAEEEVRAFRARGVLHTRLDDLRAAIEAYTRALSLVRDPDTLALRGWTYLALDAPELAGADFDEALAARPKAGPFLLGRANARVRAGRAAEATADAEAGLAAGPADARTLYQAARVYAQAAPLVLKATGDTAATTRAVRRAADLLDRAAQATPAADRGRFWATFVRGDRAFDGIRAGDAMAALDAKYAAPRGTP